MTETAQRWLAFARDDLRIAELAFPEALYNQVCFHSQQCIEKALKASLANAGKSLPRTHSITDLLEQIPSDLFPDLKDELGAADDYYIPTRYPDALPGTLPEGLPGKEDAEGALNLARRVLAKIQVSIPASTSGERWD